jgi:hypothetical protein
MSIQELWYRKARNGGLGYQYPMRGYGFYGGMINDDDSDDGDVLNPKVSKPKLSIQQQSLLPKQDEEPEDEEPEDEEPEDEELKQFNKEEVILEIPDEYKKADKFGIMYPLSNTDADKLINRKVSELEKDIYKKWLATNKSKLNQREFWKTDEFKNARKDSEDIKELDKMKELIHLYNDNVSVTEQRKQENKAKQEQKQKEKELELQQEAKRNELARLNKELKPLIAERDIIQAYKQKKKIDESRDRLDELNNLIKAKEDNIREVEENEIKITMIEPYFKTLTEDTFKDIQHYDLISDALYDNFVFINDEYKLYNETIEPTITEYFKDHNESSIPNGFTQSDINTYMNNMKQYQTAQYTEILQYIDEQHHTNDNAKTYFQRKLASIKLNPSDAFEDTHEYSDNMVKEILSSLDSEFRHDGIKEIIRINTNYSYDKQFRRVSLVDEYKVYIDNGYEFSSTNETKEQEALRKKRNKDADREMSKYAEDHYIWKSGEYAPYDNIIIVKYNDNTEMKYTIENKYYNETGGFYQYDKTKQTYKTSKITYKQIVDDNKELMNKYAKYTLSMYELSKRNAEKDESYISKRDYYKSLIDKFKSTNKQDRQDYLNEFNKTMKPVGLNIASSKFPKPALDILNKKKGIASKLSITPESYYDYIINHEDLGKYSVVLNDSNDKYGYIKYIERYSKEDKKTNTYATKQAENLGWDLFNNSKLIFLVSYSDAVKGTNWTNEIQKHKHKGNIMTRNTFEILLPGRSAYGDKNTYKQPNTDSVILTPFDVYSIRSIHRGSGLKRRKYKHYV